MSIYKISTSMQNICKDLNRLLIEAIESIDYLKCISNKKISIQYFGNHGIDYCYRGLLHLQMELKKRLMIKTVEQIGESIIDNLKKHPCYPLYEFWIERNNFNVKITSKKICDSLSDIILKPDIIRKHKKKSVLVDFSSPNIAKDMHVGHLRSTIIGESICRILELSDYNVSRINHIGDYGLQFGMLIQYLEQKIYNLEKEEASIGDLQKFYSESKKRFDTDENFKKESYNKVVLLQKGDPKIIQLWEIIKDISRKSYNQIYDRLEIVNTEVGESFYQQLIPSLIDELNQKNLLEQDSGRMIIRIPEISEVPLTIVKSDGGYTYDTTDLAAIRYRLVDLKMDKIYYVVDSGQEPHFRLIFEAARRMGWLTNQIVEHIKFGLVQAESGKKFKSREGDTVKLIDLLNEALVRAEDVLNERENPVDFGHEEKNNIIRCVAYGAIKYYDLSNNRTSDYEFSFDKMLSLKGNTAPYLQYAYVRIKAILRKGNFDSSGNLMIDHPREVELAKYIITFPEIIDRLRKDFYFHNLCRYLYKLSTLFNNFFTECRCINFDEQGNILGVNKSRLLLCEITRRVMEKSFYILGINTLERM